MITIDPSNETLPHSALEAAGQQAAARRRTPPSSTPAVLAALARTVLVAGVLGIATAHLQGRLPHAAAPLANSAGTWALVAFLLAAATPGAGAAVAAATVALLALVGGYVVGSTIQHSATSTGFIAFWCLAALVAGPLLGTAARWVQVERDHRAALGAGTMAGILIGEGVYGLTHIAHTTGTLYWLVQCGVSLAALTTFAMSRVRTARLLGLTAVITAVMATAFVAIYSQDLIAHF